MKKVTTEDISTITHIDNIVQVFHTLGITDTTLTAVEKKALDEQGYLMLPDTIDKAWLKQLRTSFEQLSRQASQVAGDPTGQESGTRHLNELLDKGPEFERVYTHPKLLAAVYHILKREFKVTGLHGRDPLLGYGQQGLHPDWLPRSTVSEPFQAVTSFWLLDDFTAENGSTRLVPGTHLQVGKLNKVSADPVSHYPGEIQVIAPAGTAFVFNAHLWHSGTRNRSNGQRRALICTLATREQRLYSQVQPENLEQLTSVARYLLGL